MESSSSSSPSSTPIPLPMAPPAGQPSGGLSKMQQEPTAAPDGPPIEAAVAASNKSIASSSSSSSRAIPIPQSRDSIYLRREKDVAPVNPVSRTDSTDSYVSHFRSRRTDTSWSSATYKTDFTDITEFDPPSPDADNFHDDPMLFEESSASSPRPFRNPGRTVTFHQDNCRPAPYSSSPDNNPVPRHSGILRLQDRSSSPRRGILRSSTGLSSARPSSVARRGSNQWPAPLAHRPRLSRHTIQEASEDTRELPTPTEPSEPAIRFEEPSETTMIRQIEQIATIEDVGLSSLSVEDAQTTEAVPEEMSDVSDSTGDIGTPTSSASGSKPDDQIVQETCDHVLRNVFGVDLQELGATDAASAAYDSVHYCLDELWHLVPAENSAGQSSPPLREVPNYGNTRGGGHAPIRPDNGGEASSFQLGGGSGGGSGGQKRPNGQGDQGGQGRQNGNGGGKRPGDRDNGGGGKRPKVAAEEPADDQKLSCPFRKRNAAKFNVRDHQSCAVQSFPDISQLKRHVKNFHKQRTVSLFACPRCKKDMQNKEGVDNHLAVPNESICTPQEAPPVHNPEDGITSRIEDVLNGRKANTKVDTWEYLWRTLFPDDASIPDSHFVPPVELEEVQCRFQTSMGELEFRIRTEMEKNANDFDQSLDDRIAQIVESCSGYINEVLSQSRFQADNAPGRPRRNRSHGHGQNPKSTSKGKSPDTQGPGSGSSSQLLTTPEASQPRAIPKNEGHDPSPNESKLSSSFETANSDGSWVHTQPENQEVITALSAQTFDQYPGLNIDTNDTFHTEIGDVPLSAATTGPAGSPDHVISPQIGHGNTTPVIAPPQAHLRNVYGNEFQVPFNGGQGQPPVPNVLDGQFHNRTDSGISGLDVTSAAYFRPSPAIANANNMNMGAFHAVPSAFHGMPAAMGYGGPPAPGQMHPQLLHQMQTMQQQQQQQQQHIMQVRIRHMQQQAQAAGQHQQVATTVTGGTIDPRMISFGVAPPMGMGNNGANSGQLYNSFSPGGSDGAN